MSEQNDALSSSGKALYIKLGPAGKWETECLQSGILRFGYSETPFDAAARGDWERVRSFWLANRGDPGTATRDVIQIRHFFEASPVTLWITFQGGLLWWCFAKPGLHKHADGEGTYRETVDGWHSCDIHGTLLSCDKLSGNLLKVQGFRGTICEVGEFDYLKRKVKGELLPQVEEAVQAENEMVSKIAALMQLMTWQDFELLVDLVFSNSGWRRLGQVGKTQKTVDIELFLPTTGERAFVQIKSKATENDLADYRKRFEDSSAYERMFFVWHSGDGLESSDEKIALIGPGRLSRMVFDAGLTSWLRGKVS
jgi:hypothetical protein